jgi:hypothetical protein
MRRTEAPSEGLASDWSYLGLERVGRGAADASGLADTRSRGLPCVAFQLSRHRGSLRYAQRHMEGRCQA